MPYAAAQQTITVGSKTTIATEKGQGIQGCEIANESQNALSCNIGGVGSLWIPPWTADFLDLTDPGYDGSIVCTPFAILSTTNPPASIVLPTVFKKGELPNRTYPYPLVRQVVGAQLQSLQYLTNVNSPNTPDLIIRIQAAGAASDNVDIYNTGQVNFAGNTGAGFGTLFSIIPGATPAITVGGGLSQTTIQGNQVSFSTTNTIFTTQPTFQSGDLFTYSVASMGSFVIEQYQNNFTGGKTWQLTARTLGNIAWHNSTDNVDGPTINATGALSFQNGTGGILGLGYFQATGNGTLSHNCGITPQIAWISLTSGTTVSYSVGTYTSTQVTVSMSASTSYRGAALG